MAEYIEKEKLLTDINNGIKAGNYEEGYEQYQNINNMDDIIETIKYSDTADVIERSRIDKAIDKIKGLNVHDNKIKVLKILQECIRKY